MASGSVVLERPEHIDHDTSHAIAAAQLRGEAKARSTDPRAMVRSIARELQELGLRPDLAELSRRYRAGETHIPDWMRR